MRRCRGSQTAGLPLIIAAAGLAAAGCIDDPGAGDSEGGWGTAIVVEELAIGVESGPAEYMFGRVQSIAVAADGTIYVSDAQPTVVRMFDTDGNFVRNVGRQGEGPGEYAGAAGLAVTSDGRLVMRSGTRVSLFRGNGQHLDGFPVVLGIGRVVVDRDDDIYVPRYEGAVEVKYSIEGEELERITTPPPEPGSTTVFRLRSVGLAGPTPAVETLSVRSPMGYLVTGRTDLYDIELRKPEGTVHLRRELEPVAVVPEEQAEWEALRQDFLEQMRARGINAPLDPVAEQKPFFREIHAGQDGRVWILRHVAAEKRTDIELASDQPVLTWREPPTYDVFQPDGTFLGSVSMPELLRPLAFRGDKVWGALIDEEGIERVVRLRVAPDTG